MPQDELGWCSSKNYTVVTPSSNWLRDLGVTQSRMTPAHYVNSTNWIFFCSVDCYLTASMFLINDGEEDCVCSWCSFHLLMQLSPPNAATDVQICVVCISNFTLIHSMIDMSRGCLWCGLAFLYVFDVISLRELPCLPGTNDNQEFMYHQTTDFRRESLSFMTL